MVVFTLGCYVRLKSCNVLTSKTERKSLQEFKNHR